MSAQIRFVRSKTYIDGLTGIKNRTAYLEYVEKIEKSISRGDAGFAVVMLDLNGLKRINDDFGHEKGDMTIKKAADIINETFSDEQVFRIGGDEFVVLLKDSSDKLDELMSSFDKNCVDANNRDDDTPVAISKGYAVFDASTDNNYQYTFERADHAMYEDKKAYYSKNNIDRRKS
jgi:diguanylate cyclase (GGDEF)-like protein